MLYLPSHFEITEPARLRAVIDAHPLATLVSVADGAPCFTHLPLLAREEAGRLVLFGHVARANPHAAVLCDGTEAVALFRGPDAYVSPRLYTTRAAVPTWNYIVVHAYGRIRRVDDDDGKERILKALIDAHDPDYRAQWDDLDEDFRARMKGAIVGLTLTVSRLEGKFKLSQNRPAQDRANVCAALDGSDDGARKMAAWMRRLGIA
ncbi:MAG: FMN-binding negative transcriptional regulator [Burkholderiaceae bacterium]|nr:FMN-binding negative transcriptional regulator [Burkholderiaceae bacterium]